MMLFKNATVTITTNGQSIDDDTGYTVEDDTLTIVEDASAFIQVNTGKASLQQEKYESFVKCTHLMTLHVGEDTLIERGQKASIKDRRGKTKMYTIEDYVLVQNIGSTYWHIALSIVR